MAIHTHEKTLGVYKRYFELNRFAVDGPMKIPAKVIIIDVNKISKDKDLGSISPQAPTRLIPQLKYVDINFINLLKIDKRLAVRIYS